MSTSIKGPAHAATKFGKSPEERNGIIARALEIIATAQSAPGKSFQPLQGIGHTDKKALLAALPAKHKRAGKLSKAARAAWTLAFAESSDRHPDALRVVTAQNPKGAGRKLGPAKAALTAAGYEF